MALIENSVSDLSFNAPNELLSNPALLFLFYRIEQILGIKAKTEALVNLNEYIEKTTGSSFVENPASYEYLLTSREKIFEISKFFTVNETYFFREEAHFRELASILPEFANRGEPLQICSAASSTGCEAYSIAMLLDYYLKKGFKFDYSIDAFDINKESIETAKTGRYSHNTIRNDGKSFKNILDSYLVYENNEIIIPDNIKRKVRFFPYNIMRGIDKQYDIIFLRNVLIYFSSKSRFIVLNNIAESLCEGGILFIGTAETSSINNKHPLITTCVSGGVFYFKKTAYPVNNIYNPKNNKPSDFSKQENIHIDYKEVSEILNIDEGRINAEDALSLIQNNNAFNIKGSSLASAAIYFLNTQDLDNAKIVISYLETRHSGACLSFLKGELHSSFGNTEKAGKYYTDACFKDKCFWPSFYRLAILASEGNRTRYEYKIKKTIESIELNGKYYECFMGGFSSEYFLKILEKKLI